MKLARPFTESGIATQADNFADYAKTNGEMVLLLEESTRTAGIIYVDISQKMHSAVKLIILAKQDSSGDVGTFF